MKTHKEIHDAIEILNRDVFGGTGSGTIQILHALNERITAINQRLLAVEAEQPTQHDSGDSSG